MIKQKRKRQELSQPPTTKMVFNDILAHGLDFNRSDLIMNRRGILSEQQVEKLMKKLAQAYIYRLLAYGLAIFVFMFLAWFWFDMASQYFNYIPNPIFNDQWNAAHQREDLHFLIVYSMLALFIMIILLSICYTVYLFVKQLHSDIYDGSVVHAIGPVSVIHRRNVIQIQIWETKFRTNHQGASSFRHLDRYVVYYLPDSRMIISAEPISDS